MSDTGDTPKATEPCAKKVGEIIIAGSGGIARCIERTCLSAKQDYRLWSPELGIHHSRDQTVVFYAGGVDLNQVIGFCERENLILIQVDKGTHVEPVESLDCAIVVPDGPIDPIQLALMASDVWLVLRSGVHTATELEKMFQR